jgi:hypothetical protein
VKCGERSDYAWVDISPPLSSRETGISADIAKVILAPRHQGTYLNEVVPRWPIHVYLLSVPLELDDFDEIPPDSVKVSAWALLVSEQ